MENNLWTCAAPRGATQLLELYTSWSEIFKSYPNQDLPFWGKIPLNKNFLWIWHPILPTKKDFFSGGGGHAGRIEELETMSPDRIKKGPLFLKTGTFWPLIMILLVSMAMHIMLVYNTNIWVALRVLLQLHCATKNMTLTTMHAACCD